MVSVSRPASRAAGHKAKTVHRSVEQSVLLLCIIGGLPAGLALLALSWWQPYSFEVRWTVTTIVLIIWVGSAALAWGYSKSLENDEWMDEVERLAQQITGLRVFADAEGKMNLALGDVGGEVLVVSQFTLYGDLRKGRRPSWTGAAEPDLAAERVEAFARALESRGLRVGRGVFGAHMAVDLLNDGPVTLVLDASEL